VLHRQRFYKVPVLERSTGRSVDEVRRPRDGMAPLARCVGRVRVI
jgi:hypothetical protein